MTRAISFLLLIAQCLTASPEWLYSKRCVYETNHDSAVIMLEGHDRLYLDNVVYYSSLFNGPKSSLEIDDSLVYGEVSQWQAGKELSIAFSSETGAVLLDPVTGRYCEIISGLAVHPLDALHQEYIGEGSTASVVVGTQETGGLWIQEIKRVYNRLRYEFPDNVSEINQAQASWETFYSAQLKVIGIANDKQGSLYSMSAAEELLKLVRDHARGMVRWGRY